MSKPPKIFDFFRPFSRRNSKNKTTLMAGHIKDV